MEKGRERQAYKLWGDKKEPKAKLKTLNGKKSRKGFFACSLGGGEEGRTIWIKRECPGFASFSVKHELLFAVIILIL